QGQGDVREIKLLLVGDVERCRQGAKDVNGSDLRCHGPHRGDTGEWARPRGGIVCRHDGIPSPSQEPGRAPPSPGETSPGQGQANNRYHKSPGTYARLQSAT